MINPSTLNGSLIGDVVLRSSNIEPSPPLGLLALFDLTGPVRFDVSEDLGRAAGVSAGPYFGSLSVDGIYLQDICFKGDGFYQITITSST